MKFNCKNKSKVPSVLEEYLQELKEASRDEQYSSCEAVLYLPKDRELRKQVERVVKEKKTKDLHEVMVVGIGGSNLGAFAVYDALRPNGVKLSFFDTAHVRVLKDAKSRMLNIYKQGGKVLINFISKSGSTNETIMNARVLIGQLRNLDNNWQKQIVVTTEPNSKLDNWAIANNIDVLPNPKNVGGRFSIMSAVGLFPLAISGVDIKKLHKGADRIIGNCISEEQDKNLALQSALAIFDAIKKGFAINNLFVFDMDLERIGKWHRQLIGESLGKDGKGICPITTVGSTDLHSMYQLFLGGPKNIFTTFVSIKNDSDIKIPSIDSQLDEIVPQMNKKSVSEVMNAIYKATVSSYKKKRLPFCEVVLDKLSEEEIGAFLQFKMIETMLLAKLMGINAFGQPNVEEYKVITRELLK